MDPKSPGQKKQGGGKKRKRAPSGGYKWTELKEAYINGATLASLSYESTGLKGSPSYVHLRDVASRESWTQCKRGAPIPPIPPLPPLPLVDPDVEKKGIRIDGGGGKRKVGNRDRDPGVKAETQEDRMPTSDEAHAAEVSGQEGIRVVAELIQTGDSRIPDISQLPNNMIQLGRGGMRIVAKALQHHAKHPERLSIRDVVALGAFSIGAARSGLGLMDALREQMPEQETDPALVLLQAQLLLEGC